MLHPLLKNDCPHALDIITTSSCLTSTTWLCLGKRTGKPTWLLLALQLREIAVGSSGGVASVHVDGYDQLMPIFIGVAEAAALVYATTGGEGRRPSTLGTWKRSLEVSIWCIL